MKYSFNTADVESGGLIPEGNYPFIINSVLAKQAEDKEYPYLEWELEISEGEFAGRKRLFRTSLSPKSLWVLVPALQAVGAIDPDGDQTVDLEIDDETGTLLEPNLVGLSGIMVIRHEMYRGRPVARVDEILSMDDEIEEAPRQPVNRAVPAPRPTLHTSNSQAAMPAPTARPAQPTQPQTQQFQPKKLKLR